LRDERPQDTSSRPFIRPERRPRVRRPGPTRQRGFWRGLFLFALLCLVAAAAAGLWVWRDYQRFLETPLARGGEPQVIDIARGQSFRGAVAQLRQAGLDGGVHEAYWRALGWQRKARIQAGEYAVEPGLTPTALLDRLARGQVIQYRITLLEGWTLRELRLALAADPVLVQTLAAVPDDELMTAIGAADALEGGEAARLPEGQFLPETYQFTRGTTDAQLLRRAHRALREALEAAWASRAPDLPLATPFQALVLASIVEKETGVPEERDQVAGVFVRRLKRGMRLQTDPTVIYGRGTDVSGPLTRSQLDADTPWNTYTRDGLPPTPIALPGRAAIHATLHPDAGQALYFVAHGSGGHVFSRTLDEHNRAVAEYRRRMRAQ
jgi:UPF0755 protein